MFRHRSRCLSVALLIAIAGGCDGNAGIFARDADSRPQSAAATQAQTPAGIGQAPMRSIDAARVEDAATKTASNGATTRPFAFEAPAASIDAPTSCRFDGLSLPEGTRLFAAGAYGGRKLGFQIDQSGHEATQIDVAVNHRAAPVVLMLGSYEPTVWNLGWSDGTKILAVLVGGYHRQAITGLPADVPVLLSTHDNKGACGYFYVTAEKAGTLNPVARRVFDRPIDMLYPARDGRVLIGDPLGAATLVTDRAAPPPESFRIADSQQAGPAGLEYAERQGLLRRAVQADADAWLAARAAQPQADTPPIAGGRPAGRLSVHNGYVVLKPFTFPAGLYGGHSATFFVPRGVPRPAGNPGHSAVYDFNTMACTGALCNLD